MSDVSVGVAYLDIIPRTAANFAKRLEAQTSGVASRISKGMVVAGAGLTAGVTAPIVAFTKSAFGAGETYVATMKKVSAATGVHGKKLDELGRQVRNVFASTPSDLATVGDAVTTVVQRFGLGGKAAGELAKQYVQLHKITGEDTKSLAEGSSKAFNAFKVSAKGSSAALDYMFKISQKTGVSVSELSTNLVTAQVPLQALGLGFKDSTALLAQLNKAGVVAPTALRGVVTGLSHYIKAKVSTSNTDAQNKAIVQAQTDPVGAVRGVFEQIQKAKSYQDALKIALPIFGPRAAQLIRPIQQGTFDTKALEQSVAGGKGIGETEKSTRTFSDSLTVLHNKITNALIPIGKTLIKVFESMQPTFKKLIGYVKDAGKWFANLSPHGKQMVFIFGAIAAAAGPVLIVVGALVAAVGALLSPVGAVIAIVALLTAGFIYLYTHTKWFPKFIKAAWADIKHAFHVGVKVVMDIVKVFINVFHGRWSKAWKGVVATVKLVGPLLWKALQGIWNGIVLYVKNFYPVLWKVVQGLWNLIVKGAVGMWHKLLPWLKKLPGLIVHALAGIGKAMFNLGKSIISWIIKGIASAPASIGKAIESKVPSWARGALGAIGSGVGTALKALPFAEGGVTGEGWSMVGERGPELAMFPRGTRIVPNHQLKGGGGNTYNTTYNVKANDTQGVLREIRRENNRANERQANHDKWSNRKFVG